MKENEKCIMDGLDLTNDECYSVDMLSVTRTHLANERTLLAYLSTFLGVMVTGTALIKLTNDRFFPVLGFILLVLSNAIPIIEIYRFIRIRKLIKDKLCIGSTCSKNKNEE